jgi:aspartate racemase
VKAARLPLAAQCFYEVALALKEKHGNSPIIMGCTEIPLGLTGLAELAQVEHLHLMDPAKVLATSLARRAYA